MSLNNFIPQLWSDQVLATLRANLVFGNLFNSNYQGLINQMGDTVRISAIGNITITSYSKDTDLVSPQSLTDAQTMLTISQAKYYNFEIDDVDQAQINANVMEEATSYAAYSMAQTMDQYYATFYTDALTTNNIGTSGSPVVPAAPVYNVVGGGTTLYDYLVLLNQKLSESNVPSGGRWVIGPPWMRTLLMLDPRFTSYNTAAAQAALTSGQLDASGGTAGNAYIGKVDSLDAYVSVNATHLSGTVGVAGSVDVFLAGHSIALTKAEGLVKTEAYRPPLRFADAIKGLALYGAKTVRPQALAVGYFQHPA